MNVYLACFLCWGLHCRIKNFWFPFSTYSFGFVDGWAGDAVALVAMLD
jgi:hypothetical protein